MFRIIKQAEAGPRMWWIGDGWSRNKESAFTWTSAGEAAEYVTVWLVEGDFSHMVDWLREHIDVEDHNGKLSNNPFFHSTDY